MKKRTPAEVGSILRQRRDWLGLTQEECGASSALVKNIERGTAPSGGRGGTRAAYLRSLRWPPDAMDRLANGDDPSSIEEIEQTAGDPPPWDELLDGQRRVTEALERLAARIEER